MTIQITKKNFIETLELTFNARYISARSTERKGGWGVWEAVREFMQNAKDADDLGNEMWVTYTNGPKGKGGKLHVVNRGVSFGREALVLGGTTKDGDPRQRGQFGEGFKLASAVLVDHECPVTIENGAEIWIPRLGKSEKFGGAEILLVDVYRNPKPQGQYHVVIDNLSRKDYAEVKERCLFLDEPKKQDVVTFGSQRILLGEAFVGSLYSRGLYVGQMPEKCAYGYDLDIVLDRDRKMADPWSLRFAVRDVLKAAVRADKIPVVDFLRLLQESATIEAKVFAEFDDFNVGGAFYEKVAEVFISEHGKDAVPVSEMSESMEAKHHGLKGVVVSQAVRKVVEKSTGTFENRKTAAASDIKTWFGADDLTDEESASLAWLTGVVSGTSAEGCKLNVVEFVGPKVLGQYCPASQDIRLARRVLSDRMELVATFVHEAAHWGGTDDGSVEHQQASERLFAEIIVKLAG